MKSNHTFDFMQGADDNPVTKKALRELYEKDPVKFKEYMEAKVKQEMESSLGIQFDVKLTEQPAVPPPASPASPAAPAQPKPKKERRHQGKSKYTDFNLGQFHTR